MAFSVGDIIKNKGGKTPILAYVKCCGNDGYFVKSTAAEGGWKANDTESTLADHVPTNIRDEMVKFVSKEDIEEEDVVKRMKPPEWTTIVDRESGKIALVETTDAELVKTIIKEFPGYTSDQYTIQPDECAYPGGEAQGSSDVKGGKYSSAEFIAKHLTEFDTDIARRANLTAETTFKELLGREDVLVLNIQSEDVKEKTKKEYRVSEGNVKETLVGSAKTMADAGLHGIKLAGVGRAQEAAYNRVVDMCVDKLGIKRETLEDPKVKALIMGTMPLAMHPLASMFEDKLPHADKVKDICELSMTETSRKHSDELMSFALDMFGIMYQASTAPIMTETKAEAKAAPKVRIKVNYDKYRVPELKKIVKGHKLRMPAKANRSDIINLLEEYDVEQAELELEESETPQVATATA